MNNTVCACLSQRSFEAKIGGELNASLLNRVRRIGRTSFALRKALRIASQILVMVFLVVLIAASLTILPGMRGDRTITLGISMYPVYLALPEGGGLMLLVTA